MRTIVTSLFGLALALSASGAFAAETAPTQGKGVVPHEGKMFQENDTNNDGAISKDEWRVRGDKMFSETDANSDGKLTQEEMKAHREKNRAAWKEKREERKENMGALKEKMKERQEGKTKPTGTPPAEAVKQ